LLRPVEEGFDAALDAFASHDGRNDSAPRPSPVSAAQKCELLMLGSAGSLTARSRCPTQARSARASSSSAHLLREKHAGGHAR
jgi:hypothetical protein